MEHNTIPIDQFWPLLVNRLLQTVELLTVEDRIEGLAIVEQLIVDGSLPIPPKTHRKTFLAVNPGLADTKLQLEIYNKDV